MAALGPLASVPVAVTVARRRTDEVLDLELRHRIQRICGLGGPSSETPSLGPDPTGPLSRNSTGPQSATARPRTLLGATQREGGFSDETVWCIDLSALFSILELVGRDATLVVVVWLSVPNQRGPAIAHALRNVRRRPGGLWVQRTAVAPHVFTVAGALLALHLAALRNRTAAQWAVIDARRQFQTAAMTAEHLGCSRQNVSHTLARANVKLVAETRVAFEALLAMATDGA